MITTDALKYLPQMGLDPSRVVGCAAAKCQELFRTGEWICRRSNRCGEILDRLLLLGWLLPQRAPIELLCEGVMRQPQVCKHQVCDHCGGRFGMVTHRWWGNKFCKRTCKDAYLREVMLDRDIIRRWFSLPSRRDTFKDLSPLARIFGHNVDPIFAKFRRARVLVGDAARLALPSAAFDFVVSVRR
jgi:hypothetical protein